MEFNDWNKDEQNRTVYGGDGNNNNEDSGAQVQNGNQPQTDGNFTYGQSFVMYGGSEENKGEKNKKPLQKKAVAVILIVVLSAGVGFGGGLLGNYVGDQVFDGGGSSSSININPNDELNTAEVIATKVMPSVVGISTQTKVTQSTWYGGLQTGIAEGVGTGIIVDENGYIITNSHVVQDGQADTITVQLSDGKETQGKVLWCDSTLDLAIVKVEEKGLTAAELGNSDDVNIGAYAVAIGNPLGLEFQRSLTQGVISGLDRTITVSDGQNQMQMDGLIQTDASINSGNSGGPLLNSKGQVIGINSAKVSSSEAEGLGFAIPINTAKPIIEEIKEKGEFTRAYIGISGISVETILKSYPDTDLGTDAGVYVAEVTQGGGAQAAGIQKEDIITALDDIQIDSMSRLNAKLINYRPGDQVTLTVLRDKKEMKVTVTLQAGATV